MLFTVVPINLIGLIIMPIGTLLTLWVLLKKIHGTSIRYYLLLGVFWTLIAIGGDYFFLVKAFKLAD